MSKKYKKNIPQKSGNKTTKSVYEIKEQTAYFVKNRLPAFILAGFMIFWTIAGILGIVAYARGNTRKTAMVTASAQTAVQYDNSIYEVQLIALNGVGANLSDIAQFAELSDNPTLVFNGNAIYWTYGTLSSQMITQGGTVDVSWLPFNSLTSTDVLMYCSTDSFDTWYSSDRFIPYSIQYTLFFDSSDDTFNIDFDITVRDRGIGESSVLSFMLSAPADFGAFSCPFVGEGSTGDSLSFSTPCYGVDIYTAYEWYQRYLQPSYDAGFNDGYNKGYGEGKTVGYNNGKTAGYYEGVNDANDYSFTGLLSAVFDVPVQTFTSLFNFDLLGVNLANFFFALLTVAILLAFVRLML